MLNLRVDAARLSRELDTLAGFSDEPAPAVTRVVYTPTDLKARAYVRTLLREADLTLREDALGNLFARWEGAKPDLPAVATGSHIDAIPHAGRFDGTVGVLGALEAFRALRAAGFVPVRPLELVLFTAEEPTRFGVGCLGSRALAGGLGPEALAALRDAEGVSVPEAARRAGFTGALEDVALPEGHFHAFVELHIEQGPQLEASGVPIGVVTAIAAPATLHVTLTGSGGHAGAVLMRGRRDALLTAAEVALEVEAAALATEDPDTVATVGILDVHPRAVNAVPSRTFLTVDARDTLEARRDAVVTRIRTRIADIAERRGVTAEVMLINADPPAACDPALVAAAERAAAAAGLPSQRLVSRAYHDTLLMARVCPVGMIFIPSQGGVSHRPDEYSSPQEVAQGAEVLARTLAALASETD
jgi:ureidoglycolate amidohydrolase